MPKGETVEVKVTPNEPAPEAPAVIPIPIPVPAPQAEGATLAETAVAVKVGEDSARIGQLEKENQELKGRASNAEALAEAAHRRITELETNPEEAPAPAAVAPVPLPPPVKREKERKRGGFMSLLMAHPPHRKE